MLVFNKAHGISYEGATTTDDQAESGLPTGNTLILMHHSNYGCLLIKGVAAVTRWENSPLLCDRGAPVTMPPVDPWLLAKGRSLWSKGQVQGYYLGVWGSKPTRALCALPQLPEQTEQTGVCSGNVACQCIIIIIIT